MIPSFTVGRTQEMLYAIRQIKQEGMVKGHDGFPVVGFAKWALEDEYVRIIPNRSKPSVSKNAILLAKIEKSVRIHFGSS